MSLRPAGATEGETPFQKQQRQGRLEKQDWRKSSTGGRDSYKLCRNDKMRGTHTHKDFVHFYYFVCMPCVLCVLGGSWRMCHNIHV